MIVCALFRNALELIRCSLAERIGDYTTASQIGDALLSLAGPTRPVPFKCLSTLLLSRPPRCQRGVVKHQGNLRVLIEQRNYLAYKRAYHVELQPLSPCTWT